MSVNDSPLHNDEHKSLILEFTGKKPTLGGSSSNSQTLTDDNVQQQQSFEMETLNNVQHPADNNVANSDELGTPEVGFAGPQHTQSPQVNILFQKLFFETITDTSEMMVRI